MKIIISFLVISLFFSTLVFAQVVGNNPVTVQTPQRESTQFSANPGTYQTVYTAGPNGSKIIGLLGTSSDPTTAHIVNCSIFNATIKYGLVSFNLPINSGYSAAAAVVSVNGLATASIVGLPVDHDGNPFFYMVNGDTLQCTYNTAFTSGVINITAIGGDF